MDIERGEGRFATAEAARRAIELALPMIASRLGDPEVSGQGVLHLVVLDPAARQDSEAPVLAELSIGDGARWDVDYAEYAREKARLSWRHRMDSRLLQLMYPHRLALNEGSLWGGVWLDGIVVAASGAQPIWDECFALCVAAHLRCLSWISADPSLR
ncbi:hypothetical protein LZ017_15235 [Pelomonas sp. CA6]|uniref:hypothetical protein n=1 Tax=Pelomonas sp. CA6 TaxID=2907999 RepID=UPI001F4C16ED|nr:hypothetical protein [Pelomonas sp. CA6]MCH7344733.1 hypothetical protein [Pelomonas sp. CA6]